MDRAWAWIDMVCVRWTGCEPGWAACTRRIRM
ncbi:hypothetical protein Tbis_2799 [Thermobispora bispora DSM 43833]|uniref:Uncharacterized protein n=1 Tax=Thermobispora bispora (strain ATCC 19993 / DSM 43833 / CBS 139.67 / JCM 10125 / KCTC 9307 / NBRC 14880 / R51) TaxID=469371 RepID=D6Y682_THEBD|nr:hypothetical protein Tbis_2799 [Thermobispora bispora DSM 43833]